MSNVEMTLTKQIKLVKLKISSINYPYFAKEIKFCCKIEIFEKIKWFFASNIHHMLVLRFMISNKFYYVETVKVLNSKDVSC